MRNITSILFFVFLSCKSVHQFKHIKSDFNNLTFNINKKATKGWHLKDIENDSIIGISLQRAYDSLLVNKKTTKITVAIIDTEVDIHHKKLIGKIWYNKKEIPNNYIDDDNNGYIDDINGWNFKGNKKGESSRFVNFEYVRILRMLNKKYKKLDSLAIKKDNQYALYKRAKKAYDRRFKYEKKEQQNNIKLNQIYYTSKNKVYQLLKKKKEITIKMVDSLKEIKKISDIDASYLTSFIKYNIDSTYIANEEFLAKQRRDKLLNLKYNDRITTGDDENNILDSIYGNNIVNENLNWMTHGTKMAGVINNILKKKEAKIMPIVISGYGDEHDKDIALAIRYAVNNGAKVINLSFGKEFSKNFNWVKDAIQYAEKKDVLLISSAGNFSYNLNEKDKKAFPNDSFDSVNEISDNFLLIGASSYTLNEKLKRKSSNYGNSEVDLFAPGYKISTIGVNKNNTSTGGTSAAAAITSGSAALIRSYYPNLTASQVKHILMDSGLEFTIEVSTPTKTDKKKTTPFNKLSKSGKILNVYNALIMADSINRN